MVLRMYSLKLHSIFQITDFETPHPLSNGSSVKHVFKYKYHNPNEDASKHPRQTLFR